MIDGFHLLRPELLWALTACPIVALALWYRRVHQGDWTKVIDADLLPFLMPDQTGKTQRSRVWIPTLLLALVTVAAAGPSLQRVELPVIKRADALVIVLDQATKLWIVAVFDEWEVLVVWPVFNLTLVYNTGAAFSLLADAGGWQS